MYVLYSDLNIELRAKQPDRVFNDDVIYQGIVAIFSTRKKTRPFRRSWGSRFRDYLFDPIDDTTALVIQAQLPSVLAEYEPRVSVISANVLPDFENQGYYFEIQVTIPSLGNKPVTYDFLMRRRTDG